MASISESTTSVIDEIPTSLESDSSSSAAWPLGENELHGLADVTLLADGDVTGPVHWPSELKQTTVACGIDRYVLGWVVLLHIVVLAAPFTFTWQGLVALVGLHWLTGGIGICLGYHRLLTHGSFRTYAPIRWCLALIGGLAGEGAAVDWVANHRKHHAFSDDDGDPHSPCDGGWWSHTFWFLWDKPTETRQAHFQRWAPDLLKDPVLVWIGHLFLPSSIVLGGLLALIGYAWGGWQLAVSLLVWGIFVRLVLVMHSTWLVNSASHIWGYRNYKTKDNSRNLWWVSVVTYGEGWHNNHHAYPSMANHGHRWWEFDMTFWAIRVMKRLGLAWNVVDYKQRQQP